MDALPADPTPGEHVFALILSADVELVRLMLEKGVDLTVVDEDGNGVVFVALEMESEGGVEILRLLLEAGAPTGGHEGMNGWTPVHVAAAWGMPGQLEALLDSGAPVDGRAKLDGGPTALAEAAGAGRADSVEILLRRGADRNRRDDFGNTPLSRARETLEGPGVGSPITPHLRGGLKASAGRSLHIELGWSGKSGHQREVIELLQLG